MPKEKILIKFPTEYENIIKQLNLSDQFWAFRKRVVRLRSFLILYANPPLTVLKNSSVKSTNNHLSLSKVKLSMQPLFLFQKCWNPFNKYNSYNWFPVFGLLHNFRRVFGMNLLCLVCIGYVPYIMARCRQLWVGALPAPPPRPTPPPRPPHLHIGAVHSSSSAERH